MATQVRYSLPEREIEQSGITFTRKVDGEKHGELTIRQNHLEWKPRGFEYTYRVPWKKFAEFAQDQQWRVLPKTGPVKSRKKLKGSTE